MKKFIIIFLIISVYSCDLQREPKFDVPVCESLNTGLGIESAVNGMYQSIHQAYGRYYLIYPDLISDIIEIENRVQASDIDVYRRNLVQSGGGMWSTSYDAINRANNIISVIEGDLNKECNVKTDEIFYRNNKDRMLGEAYLIRGMIHFELVRMFGAQYGTCNKSPQSGVILKLQRTVKRTSSKAATVEEVYQQIIDDLKKAYQLLPESYNPDIHPRAYAGRAKKDVASAFLAQVYFQMANRQANKKALKYINLTLSGDSIDNVSNNKYPLEKWISDKANPFWYTGVDNSTETIFQIINRYTNNINDIKEKYRGQGGFAPQYVKSNRLDKILEEQQKESDFIEKFQTNNGEFFHTVKYKKEIVNLPVIRAPELLLTRAEILLLMGKREQAEKNLEKVQQRYNAVANYDNKDFEEMLSEIVFDRIAELSFEGDRLHHIKRMGAWNKNVSKDYPQKLFLGRRNSSSYDASLPWDASQLIFPIPRNEIFSNPDIRQTNPC